MPAPVIDARPALLPHGRRIELRGRGTTFLRQVDGRASGPPVVLLHGWIASGGLNWFTSFDPIGEAYPVLAPDLRGHGRGIRSSRRFRLSDCADDVAAMLERLDTGPVIAVGYSMGGPVAQLLWKRHPHLVSGLVLCATSSAFVTGMRDRMIFGSAMAAAAGGTRAGMTVARAPLGPLSQLVPASSGSRPETMRAWAAAEMRRHDVRTVLEAGQAINAYDARRWIGEVDVPTTVLVTGRDRAIAPRYQLKLAEAIPGAEIQRVDDGHIACAKQSFGPSLRRAVDSVAARLAA